MSRRRFVPTVSALESRDLKSVYPPPAPMSDVPPTNPPDLAPTTGDEWGGGIEGSWDPNPLPPDEPGMPPEPDPLPTVIIYIEGEWTNGIEGSWDPANNPK